MENPHNTHPTQHAPQPTPQAINWITNTLLTPHEQQHHTIHPNPTSISNNPTATITTPTRQLFIKQLGPSWNHQQETLITKLLTPHPNTLTYITDNPHHRLIITKHIPTPNPKLNWTPHTYTQALTTLTETQTLLKTPNHNLHLPTMTNIQSNQQHTLHGLRIIETTHQLPPPLQTLNKTNRNDLIHLTRTALNQHTQPHRLLLTPQHTDATPENWILTPNKPILIDYGTYALAPTYWDINLLTLTAPLPPQTKLHHTLHTGTTPQHITHTALYFLTLLLSHETTTTNPNHYQWVTRYLNTTTQILQTLHPNLFQ